MADSEQQDPPPSLTILLSPHFISIYYWYCQHFCLTVLPSYPPVLSYLSQLIIFMKYLYCLSGWSRISLVITLNTTPVPLLMYDIKRSVPVLRIWLRTQDCQHLKWENKLKRGEARHVKLNYQAFPSLGRAGMLEIVRSILAHCWPTQSSPEQQKY